MTKILNQRIRSSDPLVACNCLAGTQGHPYGYVLFSMGSFGQQLLSGEPIAGYWRRKPGAARNTLHFERRDSATETVLSATGRCGNPGCNRPFFIRISVQAMYRAMKARNVDGTIPDAQLQSQFLLALKGCKYLCTTHELAALHSGFAPASLDGIVERPKHIVFVGETDPTYH